MKFFREYKAAILISLITSLLIFFLEPLLRVLGDFTVETFIMISESFSNFFYMTVAKNDPYVFVERNNFLLILVIFMLLMGLFIHLLTSGRGQNLGLMENIAPYKFIVRRQKKKIELENDKEEAGSNEVLKGNSDKLLKILSKKFLMLHLLSLLLIFSLFANYAFNNVIANENLKFRNDITKVRPFVSESDVMLFEAKWAGMKNKTDYKLIKDDIEVIKKENNIE